MHYQILSKQKNWILNMHICRQDGEIMSMKWGNYENALRRYQAAAGKADDPTEFNISIALKIPIRLNNPADALQLIKDRIEKKATNK